jgi:hypothetical protein
VGKRSLSGAQARGAHHRRGAHAVVRGAEWSFGHDVAALAAKTRRRMNTGALERLRRGERRENSRQPCGEHGLPTAGRPLQQQVVPPRRGHLQGEPRLRLPADLPEIDGKAPRTSQRLGGLGQHTLTGEELDHFPQRPGRPDLDTRNQRRFAGAAMRNDEPLEAAAQRGTGHRESAPNGAELPRKRQLTRAEPPSRPVRRHLPRRRQNGDRHR